MPKALPFVALLLAALAPLGEALGACDIDLQRMGSVRFRGGDRYEVFEPTARAETVFFEVRHKAGDACAFFVTFSPGGAGSYDRRLASGADELAYQVYDGPSKSNVLKALPEASAAEVLAGEFGPGLETVELSYYVEVPPLQVVPPGSYADQITLSLYEGTLTNHVFKRSQGVRIDARVRPTVQVCVVGCGALFDPYATRRTLDFGRLETGEIRNADVLVRANTDYTMLFSSENRGVMRHVTLADSSVPYLLTVNGDAVDLGAPHAVVAEGAGPTTATGDRFTVSATVGTLDNALAGPHADNINVTVRAR
ncbi:MAG: spore coat protein U domain-containing protein [Proteobacteria bacterium]|nr:spore coat protein U domain-containing protein [Pseudomonadota bacterium]